MTDIAELVDRYWQLAYAEGRGNRQHDNEAGDAQQCRHEIDRRLKHLLDVGGGAIGLLERAIFAEARADASEKRCEELEAALRDQFCPRPCNGRPDQFGVGDCVDAGECGCSAALALSTKERR